VPFDSDYKFMATFHRWTDRADQVVRCFLKGAPDVLAGRADRYLGGTEILPLDDTIRQRYIRANAELAEQGMRVLAIGVQDFPADAVEADDPMDLLDRIVLVALSASSTHPAPRPRMPSRSAATPASGSA
jgi:Ca2+-transporting ATPase